MRFFLKSLLLVLVIASAITIISWKNVEGKSRGTKVTFRHKVGNRNLVLFDETYTNAFNEPFVVSKFRYYISNFVWTDETGRKGYGDGYCHLIDEADSSSKKIQLNSSEMSRLVSLEFTIGVDSSKNTSGVQTGDLDPMKGMFWTWNSGYVFAKLEGTSDSSNAASHYFNFDVGGYKAKENAIRKIKLNINGSTTGYIKEILIDVDVSKFFNAVHAIPISKTPICHQPGKLAMKLADNYATMFSIAEIK